MVLWADGRSGNYGVRVLAAGMAYLARAAWGPSVEVNLQNFSAGDSDVSFGGKSVARDIGRSNGPIKSKLRQYDIILDSGAGDSFSDIYGIKRLAIMVYVQHVACKLGIPLALGPQTIGPFNTTLGRSAARRSLNIIDTIIARDSQSAHYAQMLGRKVDATSTDVVFALPDPARCEPRDIVVNISGLLWSGDRHVDSVRYRREIFELVAGLQRSGREVSLLAHVVGHNRDDDVHAIQEFQLGYAGEVEAIFPTSLDQVRSILASANLVIGSRMHACLNALSSGTPAIAWAYSRKFAPLMSDIGWGYILDLTNPQISPATETLDLIASVAQTEFEDMVHTVRGRAREKLTTTVLALRNVKSSH